MSGHGWKDLRLFQELEIGSTLQTVVTWMRVSPSPFTFLHSSSLALLIFSPPNLHKVTASHLLREEDDPVERWLQMS